MRVLVLTRYARMGASSRLRMLQYIESGSLDDVQCDIAPLLGDAYLRIIYAKKPVPPLLLMTSYVRRLRLLFSVHRFDMLWIEKELFPNLPSGFEWLLARAGIPYIVDYDDPIFHNYDLSRNPVKRLMSGKIGAVMRNAAVVVAGNAYLADYARASGAARVEIIPTVVDMKRYAPAEGGGGGDAPIVIGWIGSPTTAKFLEPILPVIARLAEESAIELAVVGAHLDRERHGFARCRPWSEATEVRDIGSFDIGIMPLSDDRWERGKSGCKLIQYMACARPVIASPVGANRDIVQEGVNGYLADAPQDWYAALSALANNAELRRTMGQRGRALVEQKYCVEVTAPKLLALMRGVAARRAPRYCV
jgi:glycosyltransferase involved in cell wall biosynthesis